MGISKHTVTTYTIDCHPNPQAVFDWIRANWHNLGEYCLEEFVDSFKALAKALDTTCDYSVSNYPDRGEYLRLGEYDEATADRLVPENCPLTGACWDHDLIAALQAGDVDSALNAVHNQGDWLYSDEGLAEFCEANEYEFLASGEFYT